MSHVEVRGLTYRYPRSPGPSLTDVDLVVEKGELVLLAGPSGGGKTTLLKSMCGLVPHYHGGRVKGRVKVAGRDTRDAGPADLFGTTAMVFQDPESQLVMTSARNDIAFGLQNLGWPAEKIEARLEELCAILDIEHLLDRYVPGLSGGEKQRLAIAAAAAPGPEVLLLDEPTSQLDPESGRQVLKMVRRLNRREGITVVMSEHRLDRCMWMADRVVVLEGGKVEYDGGPRGLVGGLCVGEEPGGTNGTSRRFSREYIPPVSMLHHILRADSGDGVDGKIPLTLREAKGSLTPAVAGMSKRRVSSRKAGPAGKTSPEVLRCRDLTFGYNGADILKGIDMELRRGEVLCMLGPNGAGKTTLVRHFNGLLRPRSGAVEVLGEDICSMSTADVSRSVGYLGQDVRGYLTKDMLHDELAFTLGIREVPEDQWEERIARTLRYLGIRDKVGVDPRTLSCGGRHLAALAAVLVAEPRILVLDEPTRGVDPTYKARLSRLIRTLSGEGTTIVVVTQDVEFAAVIADRCVLVDGGKKLYDGPPAGILARPGPYCTQTARLFRAVNAGDGRPGKPRLRQTSSVPMTVDEARTFIAGVSA